jgi:hypothetical protein
MKKFVGGVVGFFLGGFGLFVLFGLIVNAVCGPVYLSDMTTGSVLLVFFSPVAALVGAIMGAVAGVRVASPEEPGVN